jgi:2-polyprenyl-6-methoxyphenol hydroxylase-like FAD-dependent oxidoreductase
MKVLIVGAGFGGLALAASLSRDGHAVTIIEKGQDRKQLGFVIGLWGNGIHTLEPFGVVEQIARISIPITKEFIRDQAGKIIAHMDYQPLIDHWGKVFLLLHSDLQEILRELVMGVPLHFETTIHALKQQEHTVSITFNDGTQQDFDLVVGADGVHSQLRTLLFGDAGVTPSGLRLWLTLLPSWSDAPDEPNDLFGKGEYIGIFPTQKKQLGVLFLAKMLAEESTHIPPQEHISYLRRRFDDFGWIVPGILQSLHDPSQVFSEDIEQVSLPNWYQGRVALLGDAAHAISPTAALGGAMALEDAHVLAEELHECDPAQVEQALARYVSRRKARITEVRHTADFLIWIASMEHPTLALVRNTIMHLLPSSYLLQGMIPILEKQA